MHISNLASRVMVAARRGTSFWHALGVGNAQAGQVDGERSSCDCEQYHSIGSPHGNPQPPHYARASERVRAWRRRVLLRKGAKLHEQLGDGAAHSSLAVLDEFGMVVAWYGHGHSGAEDVVLTHVSRFYIPTDIDNNVPAQSLSTAEMDGTHTTRGWRKDVEGRVFWGATEIRPIFLRDGRLQGYVHLTRETKTISEAVLS